MEKEELKLRSNFCVLIISYGRADNCRTARWLEKMHFSAPWYIVCSTDDGQLEQYKKRYGERVIVFDKDDIEFDRMNNFKMKNVGSYARQACFSIARGLGFRYFLSLDDDYSALHWRYVNSSKKRLCSCKCAHLERMCEAMLLFLDSSEKIQEVAFCTDAMMLGGANAAVAYRDVVYKAVNTHFCDTQKWINYYGTFCDDMNAYLEGNRRGELFMATPLCTIQLNEFETGDGGMTAAYKSWDKFYRVFCCIMLSPSVGKLAGSEKWQLKFPVKMDSYVPKILPETYKKK